MITALTILAVWFIAAGLLAIGLGRRLKRNREIWEAIQATRDRHHMAWRN